LFQRKTTKNSEKVTGKRRYVGVGKSIGDDRSKNGVEKEE
jgi:hypothetical protein